MNEERIIQLLQVINNGRAYTCYINTPFGNHRVIRYAGRNEVRMANEVERELYGCREVEARRIMVKGLSGSEWRELVSRIGV